eukprot:755155-Hanusia_phi.AAC.2
MSCPTSKSPATSAALGSCQKTSAARSSLSASLLSPGRQQEINRFVSAERKAGMNVGQSRKQADRRSTSAFGYDDDKGGNNNRQVKQERQSCLSLVSLLQPLLSTGKQRVHGR